MTCTEEMPRRFMSKQFVENSTFVSDWLIRNIRPFKLVKSIWKLIELYDDLPRDEWKKLFKSGHAEEYDLTEDEVIEILKSKTPLTIRIQDEIQSCRQERLDVLKTFEEV